MIRRNKFALECEYSRSLTCRFEHSASSAWVLRWNALTTKHKQRSALGCWTLWCGLVGEKDMPFARNGKVPGSNHLTGPADEPWYGKTNLSWDVNIYALLVVGLSTLYRQHECFLGTRSLLCTLATLCSWRNKLVLGCE